jgi:hypothetical protein
MNILTRCYDRYQGETFGTYTELLAELDELRNVPLLGLAYIKANDAVHLQGGSNPFERRL